MFTALIFVRQPVFAKYASEINLHIVHLSKLYFQTHFLAADFQVQKSYYLVSLVDNDYVQGDLFAAFKI